MASPTLFLLFDKYLYLGPKTVSFNFVVVLGYKNYNSRNLIVGAGGFRMVRTSWEECKGSHGIIHQLHLCLISILSRIHFSCLELSDRNTFGRSKSHLNKSPKTRNSNFNPKMRSVPIAISAPPLEVP